MRKRGAGQAAAGWRVRNVSRYKDGAYPRFDANSFKSTMRDIRLPVVAGACR